MITLDGEKYENEFAIFTPEMTGDEFEAFKARELSTHNIMGCIRLVMD